jgi:predicted hydrocarbon binding protein
VVFEGERESQADPWRRLLADNISEVIGEAARREIVPEEDASSFPCDTEGNVRWTRTVIGRMDELMDEEDRIDVLTRCAHVMLESSIRVLREIYERNHDVEELREFWQEQFIDNLKDWYDPIPQKWLDTVVREHWGQVGTREENVIIATKIPENMKGFFEAKDDNERKYHYCHCARIKGTFRMDYIRISPTYCYCGGGYYESNWERIIGKPVKVRLLKSVLKGDDVCQFVICLPEGV